MANFPNFGIPDERDLSTGSNFNPRNISMYSPQVQFLRAPVVKIFAFLELEKIISFSDEH